MISLAKKILTPANRSSSTPLGSESGVRKYYPASIHEPPSAIFGTSFTVNPEHSFISLASQSEDQSNISESVEEQSWVMEEEQNDTSNALNIEASQIMIMWPEGFKSLPRLDCFDQDLSETGTDGIESPFVKSLSIPVQISCLSDSEIKPVRNYSPNTQYPKFQTRKYVTERLRASEERTIDCIIPNDDSISYGSNHDEIAHSHSCAADVQLVSKRFQQAKRKQRSRELKMRRKTLESFDFSSPSIGKPPWSYSKSSTPSPTNYEPVFMKRRRKKSGRRRHTVEGLVFRSVISASEDSEVPTDISPLNTVESYRRIIWPHFCSSSDDMLSSSSKIWRRGKMSTVMFGSNASPLERSCVSATPVSISEMKQFRVIADIALLEEDSEFEPCAVPYENTVLLWPSAVDKPTCFENSRSWIQDLEETGFTGQEYILASQAKLSQGTKEHLQHLFLFPHHLLIAKQKSHFILKLERKILIRDLWISARREDVLEVSEVVSDDSFSFVLGWPPTNTVLTFTTLEEKSLWIAEFEKHIVLETESEDPTKEEFIRVIHKERGHSRAKELAVTSSENAFHLLQRCLKEFHVNASSSREYQLYIRWAKDQPSQPLLGHESPFIIQTWFSKSAAAQKKDSSSVHCLILHERKPSKQVDGAALRKKTGRVPLMTLFRRVQPRSTKPAQLFGRSLTEICGEDCIPRRILSLFHFLYVRGPSTVGIFRKSGGYKEVSDFKAHMNSVEVVNLKNVSIHVVASVIKDWLRNLPDCLLSCDLYQQWLDVFKINHTATIHEDIKRLSLTLPPSHSLILRHLMCILHRIQLHSRYNQMTPFNLAVCIGPNILHPHWTTNIDIQAASIEQANMAVKGLIESVETVFGQDCVELYQDLADPQFIDESDIDGSYELLTDNSFVQNCESANILITNSLESLDDILNEADQPLKKMMSLSSEGMSPDSGLATSNPQLYDDYQSARTNITENHVVKQELQKDDKPKSDLSDIQENQMVFDYDAASFSSQSSDHSTSAMITSQMNGNRNVREHIRQYQTEKAESENYVSISGNVIPVSGGKRTDSGVTNNSSDCGGKNELSCSSVEEPKQEVDDIVPVFDTNYMKSQVHVKNMQEMTRSAVEVQSKKPMSKFKLTSVEILLPSASAKVPTTATLQMPNAVQVVPWELNQLNVPKPRVRNRTENTTVRNEGKTYDEIRTSSTNVYFTTVSTNQKNPVNSKESLLSKTNNPLERINLKQNCTENVTETLSKIPAKVALYKIVSKQYEENAQHIQTRTASAGTEQQLYTKNVGSRVTAENVQNDKPDSAFIQNKRIPGKYMEKLKVSGGFLSSGEANSSCNDVYKVGNKTTLQKINKVSTDNSCQKADSVANDITHQRTSLVPCVTNSGQSVIKPGAGHRASQPEYENSQHRTRSSVQCQVFPDSSLTGSVGQICNSNRDFVSSATDSIDPLVKCVHIYGDKRVVVSTLNQSWQRNNEENCGQVIGIVNAANKTGIQFPGHCDNNTIRTRNLTHICISQENEKHTWNLPQEQRQSREPMRSIKQEGIRRSVTVVRIGEGDSVISRKLVKET